MFNVTFKIYKGDKKKIQKTDCHLFEILQIKNSINIQFTLTIYS